jgi:photosystem II stability/assembly factor-like uncharacterized protein
MRPNKKEITHLCKGWYKHNMLSKTTIFHYSRWFLFAFALILVACAAPSTSTPPQPTQTAVLIPTVTLTKVPPMASATPIPATEIPTATGAATNFVRLTSNQPITLTNIQIVDSRIGWGWANFPFESSYVHILRTEDGGNTWRDASPPQGGGHALAFLDTKTAWVTQDDLRTGLCDSCPGWPGPVIGRVWHTQDGGQTWEPSQPINFDSLPSVATYSLGMELQFTDSQSGWLLDSYSEGPIAGAYAEVFKTTDGGMNWQLAYSTDIATSTCARGFVSQDAQVSWLASACNVGEPTKIVNLYRTNDGGQTWQDQPLPSPETLPDFNIKNRLWDCDLSNLHVWALRSLSLVVRCTYFDEEGNRSGRAYSYLYTTADDGQTWQSTPLPSNQLAVFSYFDSEEVYFLNAHTAWHLGGSSEGDKRYTLYQTLDGGRSWNTIKTVNWLAKLDFINENEGWALASGEEASALLHTTDGGRTWEQLQPHLVP